MLETIVRAMKIRRARKEISPQIYGLIENIHSRYSQLDIKPQIDGKEQLSRLIEIINKDAEISKLNSLCRIGSIDVLFDGERCNGLLSSGGFGTNLIMGTMMGDKGLHICDWNDYNDKRDYIPATPESLQKHVAGYSAERLRQAIVKYTNKETFIEHFSRFKL